MADQRKRTTEKIAGAHLCSKYDMQGYHIGALKYDMQGYHIGDLKYDMQGYHIGALKYDMQGYLRSVRPR